MLVKVGTTTVLNMEKFERLYCNDKVVEERVLVGTRFFGLWPKYETITNKSYVLSIRFTFNGEMMNHDTHIKDASHLVKIVQEVVKQIKAFQPDLVTEAFEEALLSAEVQ